MSATKHAPQNSDVMRRLVSTARTERVEFAKSQSALSWTPEYQPVNIVPPSKTPVALVERWTRVSYPMIAKVGAHDVRR